MKKILLSSFAIFIFAFIYAQSPNSFNYQAVVRNTSGELVANQLIGIQIDIIQGSSSGSSVYSETQEETSNAYGLVNLMIGTGTTGDDFSTINWANGPYYIQVKMDITGGVSYQLIGTSQILSVPYALHAQTADSVTGTLYETQNLSNVLFFGNDGGAIQIKNIADPINDQDAATKAYVDVLKAQISAMEDLFVRNGQAIKDYDGNFYRIVEIGNQIWMAENLKSLHYSDGTPIDTAIAYNNDENNVELYGRLYTWNAAMNYTDSSSANPSGVQGACPSEWHIPSKDEWIELMN